MTLDDADSLVEAHQGSVGAVKLFSQECVALQVQGKGEVVAYRASEPLRALPVPGQRGTEFLKLVYDKGSFVRFFYRNCTLAVDAADPRMPVTIETDSFPEDTTRAWAVKYSDDGLLTIRSRHHSEYLLVCDSTNHLALRCVDNLDDDVVTAFQARHVPKNTDELETMKNLLIWSVSDRRTESAPQLRAISTPGQFSDSSDEKDDRALANVPGFSGMKDASAETEEERDEENEVNTTGQDTSTDSVFELTWKNITQ